MKQSTSILRGMNDIRASYILESELTADEMTAAYRPTFKERWQQVTSGGWFAAAVCAVVAFGTLAGIIWAGQRGPGVVTPVGTLPESTAETEVVEEITLQPIPNALRGLKREITYNADGTEDSRTKYTYEDGLLVKERYYLDSRGFAMKEYTYNENGLVIQEKYTFDEIASAGWTTTYEYDGEGRVILRRDVYDNNKPAEETRTEYDEFGRIFREESKDSVTTYTYGENGSYTVLKEYKNEATVTRLETITDERSNVIRERSYQNEELTHDYVYEYNENGQKIKAYSCPTDGSMSVNNVTYYDYDESGNLVRITFTTDEDQITSVYSYEYNEYGERTKEILYTYMDSELASFTTVVYEYGIIS